MHIPGKDNKRADYLSRQPDAKNYRLNPEIFLTMCKRFHYWPQLDLFANRQNRQTQQYCSWRLDLKSKGNAFQVHWGKQANWLNPPWELISTCLNKLESDGASALCCLPVWQTAPWWPQLQRLMMADPVIIKGVPIYTNPEGKNMPAPRWGTLFCTLNGKSQC